MRRAISGLVLAPFLLFGSAWAPLHVHKPGSGHSHAVVHSHLTPHHVESHHPEGPEIEPDAERVVWLESPTFHTATYHVDSAPAFIASAFHVIPAVSSWSPTSFDAAAPAHGPPRGHPSFRGPPHPLA